MRAAGPAGAIWALRLNYRWRGVWVWLRGRHDRWGMPKGRGWWLVLRHPWKVQAEQAAIAEGVIL